MTYEFTHQPVLLQEVLDVLKPSPGETIVDCTLGLGGHAEAFLNAIGPEGKLIGLDADQKNLEMAKKTLQTCNVELLHMNFKELGTLSTTHAAPMPGLASGIGQASVRWVGNVDIIFADLGLSSPHLDDPTRGFTFREDAPLDMRFDQLQGATAADIIAANSEEGLAGILFRFGELRQSRKLAPVIKEAQPKTTFELRDAVENVAGFRAKQILPQVFQALRIAVNDELNSLNELLNSALTLLKPGGRFGIISFHSLEDRTVKQFFRDLVTSEKDPVTGADVTSPSFQLLTKKAIKPSDPEIERNPRSRSARFRAIIKIA